MDGGRGGVLEPLRLRTTGAPAVTAAGLLVVLVLSSGVLAGTRSVAELLLVACPVAAVVAVFLLPVLVVGDDGLDVVGVLHRRWVPWAAVSQVRQGWFLVLELTGGRSVVCLAAPVVGSMPAFRTLDEDGYELLSRRSAQHPAFHGARGSLAVELVSARRPAGAPAPAPADGGRPQRRLLPVLLFGALGLLWCAAVLVERS